MHCQSKSDLLRHRIHLLPTAVQEVTAQIPLQAVTTGLIATAFDLSFST